MALALDTTRRSDAQQASLGITTIIPSSWPHVSKRFLAPFFVCVVIVTRTIIDCNKAGWMDSRISTLLPSRFFWGYYANAPNLRGELAIFSTRIKKKKDLN